MNLEPEDARCPQCGVFISVGGSKMTFAHRYLCGNCGAKVSTQGYELWLRKGYMASLLFVSAMVLSFLHAPVWLAFGLFIVGLVVLNLYAHVQSKRHNKKIWILVSVGTPKSVAEVKSFRDSLVGEPRENNISPKYPKISSPVFWLVFVVLFFIAFVMLFGIADYINSGTVPDCSRYHGCNGEISRSISPDAFYARIAFLSFMEIMLVCSLYGMFKIQYRKWFRA